MTLTKDHRYADHENDSIEVQTADDGAIEEAGSLGLLYLGSSGGAYVEPKFAAPLALNILGHDRPDDDPLAAKFSVEDSTAHIASSQFFRDEQLNLAAALLMAVDAYDRREKRRATAEERRERAAESLSRDVARLNAAAITSKTFGGDEIGKLREALGRFDAALAN